MKKIMSFFRRYKLLFQKFRFYCLRDGSARASYLKKHCILREQGEHVYFYSRIFPADPQLIKIHNNVAIATNVRFINHDRMDYILKGMRLSGNKKYHGCIEVMDNVFIGADVTILPNVRIGPNAVIGAGSVVTKDIPENSVAVGVPARVIGSFDGIVTRRLEASALSVTTDGLWEQFDQIRTNK